MTPLSPSRLEKLTKYYALHSELVQSAEVLSALRELRQLREKLDEAKGTLHWAAHLCEEWRGIYSGEHPGAKAAALLLSLIPTTKRGAR